VVTTTAMMCMLTLWFNVRTSRAAALVQHARTLPKLTHPAPSADSETNSTVPRGVFVPRGVNDREACLQSMADAQRDEPIDREGTPPQSLGRAGLCVAQFVAYVEAPWEKTWSANIDLWQHDVCGVLEVQQSRTETVRNALLMPMVWCPPTQQPSTARVLGIRLAPSSIATPC